MYKGLFLLSILAGIISVLYGCFESKEGEQGEDIGALLKSPDEAADTAADILCEYLERCPQYGVICNISDQNGVVVNVHCEFDQYEGNIMGPYDECTQRMVPIMAEGFRCVELTPEIEDKVVKCLEVMRSGECSQLTEQDLREHEAAYLRGEETSLSIAPELCVGLEEVFDCADDDTDSETGETSVENRCVEGQIAFCECPDGAVGKKVCNPDGTYSECFCE